MLFALTYTPRSGLTEEQDKRILKLFTSWRPPAGVEFKGFYDYADGDGGIAVVETVSAEALLEATAPWTAFEFRARPVVPVEKSTPILEKAFAWRDSIR